MSAIIAENIGKIYPRREGPGILFGRGGIADWLRGKRNETFAALDGVNLRIEHGESIGIIGGNGSGKSTLLKILAGVTLPTTGAVTVEGRVASLLELGAGFHPMLTGRENVYLNAAIYGIPRAHVDSIFDEIASFSGIGEFIDRPVDTYSSGMYVRIAFAVAVHINADIFLVDEVLAVGDEEFQRKCRRKLGELREQGKTIVFVSHDLGIVNTLCSRVMLLSKGKMLERGTPQQTFDYYLRQIGNAGGVQRLQSGPHEALFSNGKFSLYQGEAEVTAPEGIYTLIRSMAQTHACTYADWQVTRDGSGGFTASGQMPRLPCRIRVEAHLEGSLLTFSTTLTAEHEFVLDDVSLVLAFPAAMDRWAFDGQTMEVRPITPEQVQENDIVTTPDAESRSVGAFSSNEAIDHAVSMAFASVEGAYLQLVNSDFLTGARRLFWTWRPAPGGANFKTGDAITLGPMSLDFALSGGAVRADAILQRQEQVISAGGLQAAMHQGRVDFKDEHGHPVAELQAMVCTGDLWTNATFLSSTPAHAHNGIVHMESRSRRLPFVLHWKMRAAADGVALDLSLEALEAVQVQETNFSLLLPAAYSSWSTENETVAYPEFDHRQEWRPLNTQYLCAASIRLQGEGAPALEWRPAPESSPVLASALNTGAGQHQRVAQWLRRPEGAAAFYFPPGMHPLLSVILRRVIE